MARVHDFWVTISGDRGTEIENVTGTNRFPITSPIPIRANLPGVGERDVYQIALQELWPETRDKIVQHLAQKYELSATEAELELKSSGIPVLAEGCTVTIHNFLRWI